MIDNDEADQRRAHLIHERWRQILNRRQGAPYYQEDWYAQQCLVCRHYIPLIGALGSDWGACTNASSPFDKTVMFEHDGCNQFERTDDPDA